MQQYTVLKLCQVCLTGQESKQNTNLSKQLELGLFSATTDGKY